MRSAIRFVLLIAVVLLIAPFILSSLLIDQRGGTIVGHVVSKDEWISVRYSSWTRRLDVSIRYDPPDVYGVAFMKDEVTPSRFDSLKVGDPVQLHYLLAKDLPDYPGLKTLRQMHLVPFVRAADQNTWSGPKTLFETNGLVITAILTVILVLFLWKALRVPYLSWAVLTCLVFAGMTSYISEFPRPMPAPRSNLRTAAGTVKSLEHCDWLFRGKRQRVYAQTSRFK